MQCPHCGALNRPLSRYCGGCGASLAVAAPPAAPLPGTQVMGGTRPALVVSRPGEPELTFPLTGPRLSIGRGTGCDIVIDSPTVSHLHAIIMEQQGAYILHDQNSRNGIYVAGQRVTAARLGTADPVRIPDPFGNLITLTLRDAGPGVAAAPPVTGGAHLIHRLGPQRPLLAIGRDPANDVTLDAPLVSRHHARVEWRGGGLLVRDLGSTNGTYVNGRRVHGAAALRDGDEIAVGLTRLLVQGHELRQVVERLQVRVDAVDLVRRTGRDGGSGTVILDNVSLSILPREFIALVGGSGAGKTTLLNALSGTAPAQEGTVLFNGQDFYRDPGPYRGMIGYVPQEDILHRELPVARALDYAAQLRLPPDTLPAERSRRVDEVLAEVKMEAHRAKPISRLSGGQRKRISIAVELLANPGVIFLDEPTSGLDPGLDKTVMGLLRLLCDRGHTIVLVTHTTENIHLCSLVAYVAGRGRLVYYGPPGAAPSFFGVSSFSDIYSLFDQRPDEVEAREQQFHRSPQYQTYVYDRQRAAAAAATTVAPPAPLSKRQTRAAAWRQWKILTARYAELLRRDRVNLALLLAQAPIVALLLAVVTSPDSFTPSQLGNTQQVLLMLTLAAIWFGTINAAREIVKERPVYLRERMVNLRIWPYVLSKFSMLAGLSAVQALVLLWLVSLKTPHLPAHGIVISAAVEMYVSLLLTSLAGMAGGLLISSFVSTADRAMSIVPVVLIAQVIFSGALFDLHGVTNLLSLLAISRWCLAALGSVANLNNLAARSGLQLADWPKVMYSSPDAAHLLGYWLVLGLFVALFLAGTCASLRRRDA